MPRLTRYFIKTALVYLILALSVGAAQSVAPATSLATVLAYLRPVSVHLFMVGWVTQLIFGVGYWMFPRHSRERPRGNEGVAWAVYILLNLGLLMRVVAEPTYGISGAPLLAWALVVSAILQWLAGVAFVANSWHRLRM
jgi:predicted permease